MRRVPYRFSGLPVSASQFCIPAHLPACYPAQLHHVTLAVCCRRLQVSQRMHAVLEHYGHARAAAHQRSFKDGPRHPQQAPHAQVPRLQQVALYSLIGRIICLTLVLTVSNFCRRCGHQKTCVYVPLFHLHSTFFQARIAGPIHISHTLHCGSFRQLRHGDA